MQRKGILKVANLDTEIFRKLSDSGVQFATGIAGDRSETLPECSQSSAGLRVVGEFGSNIISFDLVNLRDFYVHLIPFA